jgi:hypothetical protein
MTPTAQEIEAAIGMPIARWAKQCHVVSLKIVKSDLFPVARVARGWWVVVGTDCYADDAEIVDATLWSYDDRVPVVWHGSAQEGRHKPHGHGSIWKWGKPPTGSDEPIALTAALSEAAREFLRMIEPLDQRGWNNLFAAPMGGWPSREIIEAAYDDPRLSHLIPIDVVGMVTDRNPAELYLKGP